jgi:hypothetical protein
MATGTEREASELLALREQNQELQRELLRKSFEIAEVEEEMAEVARGFEQSFSWKLTKPVRALKPMLTKLLRRS